MQRTSLSKVYTKTKRDSKVSFLLHKIRLFGIIGKNFMGKIMYYRILKALGFAIYSEHDFYISKKDDTHFKVTAKSGLSANVEIAENIMFVDIIYQSKKVAYYCTPLHVTGVSVEECVVHNLQSSILFKLASKDIGEYLRNHSKVFNEIIYLSYFSFDPSLEELRDNPNAKKIQEGYFYEYTEHNKTAYSHVYFSKKNIIKNIVRYTFSVERLLDASKPKQQHTYLVGNYFFDVSNLEEFFKSTIDIELAQYNVYSQDYSYGINQQLNEKQQLYEDNIDLNKLMLLKNKNKNYCLITKNKRKMTLSYLSNFDMRYSQLETTPSYSSERAEFKGDEIPVKRYKKERLLTHTYFKGELTTTSSKFSKQDAIEHEKAISDSFLKKLSSLKCKYPSNKLIAKLDNLGLSCKTPLNPDDLTTLEMFEI